VLVDFFLVFLFETGFACEELSGVVEIKKSVVEC